MGLVWNSHRASLGSLMSAKVRQGPPRSSKHDRVLQEFRWPSKAFQGFPRLFKAFEGLSTFARGPSGPKVFQGLPSKVCQVLQMTSKAFHGLPRPSTVFQGVSRFCQGSAKVFQGLAKPATFCPGLPRPSKAFQGLPRPAQKLASPSPDLPRSSCEGPPTPWQGGVHVLGVRLITRGLQVAGSAQGAPRMRAHARATAASAPRARVFHGRGRASVRGGRAAGRRARPVGPRRGGACARARYGGGVGGPGGGPRVAPSLPGRGRRVRRRMGACQELVECTRESGAARRGRLWPSMIDRNG